MLWFKRNNLINDEELAEIQSYLEKSDTLQTYNLYDRFEIVKNDRPRS